MMNAKVRMMPPVDGWSVWCNLRDSTNSLAGHTCRPPALCDPAYYGYIYITASTRLALSLE